MTMDEIIIVTRVESFASVVTCTYYDDIGTPSFPSPVT